MSDYDYYLVRFLIPRGSICEIDRYITHRLKGNVDRTTMTECLIKAVEYDYSDIVYYLVYNRHAYIDNYILTLASAKKDCYFPIIRTLIQGGADAKNPCALTNFAKSGNIRALKLMIEHGADVNCYYHDALKHAIYYRHYSIVRLLLASGIIIPEHDKQKILDLAKSEAIYKLVKNHISRQLLFECYGADSIIAPCHANYITH